MTPKHFCLQLSITNASSISGQEMRRFGSGHLSSVTLGLLFFDRKMPNLIRHAKITV
jgi:hypothetical protein